MKLIVFLKNKKEIVIHDGKHFLQQWHTGSQKIFLSKRKKKQKALARRDIKDFIQARYYQIFKTVFMPTKRAY
ncbi:hypothetical protein KBC03_06065 [Patescibacteria group bacterium]|nr:hypothetical protein [Patescibacteria group bacterium]